MTIKHLNHLTLLLLGMAIASCTEPSRYSVDGVKDEFCVPKGYPPKGVWFVPADKPGTPHGFAIMGCKLQSEDSRESCALPDDLISASVMPLSVKVNQNWGSLRGAAVYQAVVTDPDVKYESDADTGMFTVYAPKAWPAWLIWKRADASSDIPPNPLHDTDELVASCSPAGIAPGGGGGIGGPDDFVCDRYVRGSHYALKYSFLSHSRVPREAAIAHTEQALFGQVDSWVCPKR